MGGSRKIIIAVLILMVLTMAGVGFYYWYQNRYYVSTEDARVTGDIVRVSPQIAGKLVELNIEEGQNVKKGQIIGRQEMLSLPDSSLEMAIIRSPIKGVILKKQGAVGEVIVPGQILAMIADPDKLYISANIEETKLERVKVGQKVDVTIDQYGDREFSGAVSSIGQAAGSAFSILPVSTGGNFTKVVQKVPVKIELGSTDLKLLPGTNAVVKIHIR
ncbi:MAG: hemolysin D [Firmicutes bacterium HGW-Firmicutes-14]|nr:MAG: hemolysin D [Firmicutes bacterium HGW-Firmicutes-14]